jgi:hypothetical protein
MKKLYTFILLSVFFIGSTMAQTRYIDQVFSAVDIVPNVIYGTNISVLTGAPAAQALPMEVYTPTGDTETSRPLIIHMHTGTFLPILYNGNPTGMRQDAATMSICEDYAKRGYVVANIEYRLGWNPTLPTQTERAASLMIAVYRAIQDCKAAVRYFRKDFETNGNAYGIDTSRIILSGQGSGGWVALGYATVNKLDDIQLPKFLDLTDPTNPVALVDTAVLGDWDGYGGNPALNMENNVGYSNDVHMVVSMGGGMGDLSWIEAGDVPMAAVHCPTDPTAIYSTGDVSVPQIGIVTTDISGSYDVVTEANSLGNNDAISAGTYNDPYTTAAQAASQGLVAGAFVDQNGTTITSSVDHVFPYMTGNPFESAPWDFWDSTALVQIAPQVGLTAQDAQGCHANGLATNPNMSQAKSLAYIDSTLGYFCPRIVNALLLPGNTVGVQETALNTTVSMFPNPANNNLTISADNKAMSGIEIYSTTGRLVAKKEGLNTSLFQLNNLNLSTGMYLVNIHFREGMITEKLIVK